jgi:hypothetical protein
VPFTVIYDACVLYPAPLRDLLIRLAQKRLFQARWTDQILDEAFGSIKENRPDLTDEQLGRTRDLMCKAVPDCLVTGYENLVEALQLPDPGDRHVLAAAIRGGAQTIVTTNLKHFPAHALSPYDVEAQHPDTFVRDLVELRSGAVVTVIHEQRQQLVRHPKTLPELLNTLERQGLVQTVSLLRELLLNE